MSYPYVFVKIGPYGDESKEACISKGDFNFKLLLRLWLVPRVFVVKLVFYYHVLLKNRLRSQRHLSLTYSYIVL